MVLHHHLHGLMPKKSNSIPKALELVSINLLAPGRFEWNFRHVIFKQILVIDGWGISCEIDLLWMSLDFTDDQSTWVDGNKPLPGPMLTKISVAICRAANQYGTSVFCTDFTCKIREYEFGFQSTEIELCQFCHLRYYCQNKAYLFWVANQSKFVVFYALKPSNTSLITKTFILLSSTCGSNTCSSSLPVPVVPKESTRVSTGSQWVPPE